jgi:ankyrin repeat protein
MEEKIKQLEAELELKKSRIQQLEEQLLLSRSTTNIGEEADINVKIENFLNSNYPTKTYILKSELYLSIINNLTTLYHLEYNHDLEADFPVYDLSADGKGSVYSASRFRAIKIAFNYNLEFFRQVNQKKLQSMHDEVQQPLGFPLLWLLGMFPYLINRDDKSITDSVWLPIHIFLAVDPSDYNLESYLDDLGYLLDEFGAECMEEDVSPLSIAVAKCYPTLEVVEKLLEFNPDFVTLEDEDGSIPIMHAAACNESTEVVDFLYSKNLKTIEKVDNYGGGAIHYATFSGHLKVVEYLITKEPQSVQFVEGNGALPIHDSVQNCRGYYHQLEITELLIKSCPEAVYKRDKSGALPFHKAVRSSNLKVAEALIAVFPKVSGLQQPTLSFADFLHFCRPYSQLTQKVSFRCTIFHKEKIKISI